ncbi:MAG: hypothetical protein FWD15_01595 [Alphaproteobacteria bacterium]|nr:hypothetical protein [Alphaproteobacteria bacterium]
MKQKTKRVARGVMKSVVAMIALAILVAGCGKGEKVEEEAAPVAPKITPAMVAEALRSYILTMEKDGNKYGFNAYITNEKTGKRYNGLANDFEYDSEGSDEFFDMAEKEGEEAFHCADAGKNEFDCIRIEAGKQKNKRFVFKPMEWPKEGRCAKASLVDEKHNYFEELSNLIEDNPDFLTKITACGEIRGMGSSAYAWLTGYSKIKAENYTNFAGLAAERIKVDADSARALIRKYSR